MAEQENKELSMAEILASIRKILEESGADEALRRKEAEEEVFELQPSMIVREEPAPAAKPEIPSAVPGRLISEARKTRVADEETAEYFAGANRHFAAAEEFSTAGADGFSLPGVIVGRPEEKAAAVRAEENPAEEKNTPAEETVLPPAVSAAEPDERERPLPLVGRRRRRRMFPKKSSAVLPGCLNKTISAAAPNSRLSTPMPFCAELPGRRLRKSLITGCCRKR